MLVRNTIFLGAAACAILACACSTGREKSDIWIPPEGGVVQNKKTAITIARAVWLSMHPELEANAGSEDVWQANMVATLQGDTWEVATKPKEGEIGGGLYIYISRKDSRVVDIRLTQ